MKKLFRGGIFDYDEFRQHPEGFISHFADKVCFFLHFYKFVYIGVSSILLKTYLIRN